MAYLIIIAVIILDQVTKAWIAGTFTLFESREIIPGLFNLTYLTNSGAAFGFLNGQHGPWRQVFFVAAAVIALVIMVVALRCLRGRGRGRAVSWAIALIAGGAAGNLIDRLRQGAVVDFLDFYYHAHHWPAFNLADSAITIGVMILILEQFTGGRHKNTKL